MRVGKKVQALPRSGRLSKGPAFSASTTRGEAFRRLVEAFGHSNFDEPAREARLTLCAACGLSPAAMIAAPDERLGAAASRLGEFAVRRAEGEPLSKIVGMREFWGLSLFVSRDVLDPRPETETIVEAAVALFADRRAEPIRVLDLGVGSGALLCALLVEFPAARGLGVDRSEEAAAVARANVEACRLAERAEVRIGDWTDGVDGPFDLIVSNPPYVPSEEIAGLPREVRDYDPRAALDGGQNGLDAFRAIIPASAALLSPDGRLIVEVGAGQARSVFAMAGEAGFRDVTTWRDFAGVERALAARSPRRV
jgi:release factor glutamine methyltransferase